MFRKIPCLFAVLALLLAACPAAADQITLTFPPDAPEAKAPAKDKLLLKAFEQAVQERARSLLGSDLPAARQARVDAFLAARAQGLVQSYSELSFQSGPEGLQAVYDVSVDRAGLSRLLEQAGVSASRRAGEGYVLRAAGLSRGVAEELAGLELLSGLTRQEGDGLPVLALESAGKGYAAVLSAGGEQWRAGGDTLETVWLRAWGGFFSRGSVAPRQGGGLTLHVSGWSAPDGVEPFAKGLAAVHGMDECLLSGVVLAAEGVSARFTVRTRDRAALEAYLKEATAGRGLTWELSR